MGQGNTDMQSSTTITTIMITMVTGTAAIITVIDR